MYRRFGWKQQRDNQPAIAFWQKHGYRKQASVKAIIRADATLTPCQNIAGNPQIRVKHLPAMNSEGAATGCEYLQHISIRSDGRITFCRSMSEHASKTLIYSGVPFAIVVAVLAFLPVGSARQRPRIPGASLCVF